MKFTLKRKDTLKIISIVAALGIITFSAWSLLKYRQAKKVTTNDQTQVQQQEADSVLNQLKKHMILPSDETPTVATLNNIDELSKTQPFFKGALSGDKLIVYPTTQKAIIFSPQRNIIVNVGTLILSDKNTQQ